MVDNSVTISIMRMLFETSSKETQKYENYLWPFNDRCLSHMETSQFIDWLIYRWREHLSLED